MTAARGPAAPESQVENAPRWCTPARVFPALPMDDPPQILGSSTPAGPPVLKPLLLVPLHAERDGSYSGAAVQFAESPTAAGPQTTLVTIERVAPMNLLTLLRWHSPTIASLAMLAIAIYGWRTLRRTARNQRLLGRLYCRLCNYDLTPPKPGDQIAAACSECGCSTARKPPIMAEPMLFRLLTPFVTCLGALIICIALLGWTLHWPATAQPQLIWPLPGITMLFPRYTLSRQYDTWDAPLERVTRTAIPSGAVTATRDVENPYGYVSISPDGTTVASHTMTATVPPAAPGWQSTVNFIDIQSGIARACPPSSSIAFVQHAPIFSRDGTKVWSLFQLPRGNPSAPVYDYEIVETEVQSLRHRVVGAITGELLLAPNGTQATVAPTFLSREDDRGVTFYVTALAQYNINNASSIEGRIYKVAPAGNSTINIPVTATSSYFPPVISADGATLSIGLYPATNGTLVVDTAAGTVTSLAPATPPATATQTTLTTPGFPGVVTPLGTRGLSVQPVKPGAFNLLDEANAPIASLTLPPGSGLGWTGTVRASASGRYVAIELQLPADSLYSKLTLGPNAYLPYVAVWDLAPLNAVQPAPQPANLSSPQSMPR